MSVVELLGMIPESKLAIPEPGLRLNAFSLVNIVVCVGMSVEFSAHILHQFISEPQVDGSNAANDRNRRVVHALTSMGEFAVHVRPGHASATMAAICLHVPRWPH